MRAATTHLRVTLCPETPHTDLADLTLPSLPQEPSSPAPQSPAPDSGHQSMPLRTWNGVSGPLEQRRASSGSGTGVSGVSQPSPAPADRQPESPRAAAVNGARQLPHKAELEVCV